MEFWNTSAGSGIDALVSRLHSQDANDRVKAAAELGEVGTEEQAPELLKVAYEDEASTVRQMAIQAYAEILKEDAVAELQKAARNHFDDYVRLYAINTLGNLQYPKVGNILSDFLDFDDDKIRAATVRALIHSDSTQQANKVFELLQMENDTLIVRNCLEALTIWRYKAAKSYVEEMFSNLREHDPEVQTFISFYLSSFGNKSARQFIEKTSVDQFLRIGYQNEHYRGKEGLLELLENLS